MTIRQAILYSLLYLLCIAASLGLVITYGWTHHGPTLLGIALFILVSFFVIALSVSFTCIIIPSKPGFNYTLLFSGKQYGEFKKAVGKRKARLINTSYLTLFFLLFSLTAYVYAQAKQGYEQYHLSHYGTIVKVGIKANEYAGNGRQYGLFDCTLDQKIYHYKLPTLLFKGDSDLVIISRRNPEIIQWLNYYKQEPEKR